jgi:alpha-glucosidase
MQTGVFYPFMRAHTAIGTADQEPWSYGGQHEALNRRAIELRYELLPHIYTVMREAAETGVPAMRPLMLEYPEDPETWDRDDQFMFGRDLLVAPVLHEARTTREVYLPKGVWYDFWSGRRYESSTPAGVRVPAGWTNYEFGMTINVPVTLQSIPIFVREGALIFRQPVIQHTGELPGHPLRVFAYPGARSGSTLYEDDGESFAYREGAYLLRTFKQSRDAAGGSAPSSIVLEVGKAEGSYRPRARRLELVVFGAAEATEVTVQAGAAAATTLKRLSGDEWKKAAEGWTVTEDHLVMVRTSDGFDGMRISIEAAATR